MSLQQLAELARAKVGLASEAARTALFSRTIVRLVGPALQQLAGQRTL